MKLMVESMIEVLEYVETHGGPGHGIYLDSSDSEEFHYHWELCVDAGYFSTNADGSVKMLTIRGHGKLDELRRVQCQK